MAENANTTPAPAPAPSEAVVVTVTEEKKNETKQVFEAQPEKNPQPKSRKLRKTVLPIALTTFLLSIPLLFQAIWLFIVQQDECEELLKTLPRLQIGIGIGLVVVFFLSNGVVYSRARFPAPGLIVVLLPLVLMFTIGLSLEGSLNTDTSRIPASPKWLKMKVHGNSNWDSIKPCLYDKTICGELVGRSYDVKASDFTNSKKSALEAGCCMPPKICGMDYINATYWRKNNTTDADAPYHRDCNLWENDETMLCYDCHSCKEGYIKRLESKWLKVGTFLVVMSILLMLSHTVLFVGTMLEHHL